MIATLKDYFNKYKSLRTPPKKDLNDLFGVKNTSVKTETLKHINYSKY